MNMHPPSPCTNCPYRTDAPRRLWHPSVFRRLLDDDVDTIGKIYHCHRHSPRAAGRRGLCAGWLLDQKVRGLPSIALRIFLARNDVAVEALKRVHDGGTKLFKTVRAMCRANGVR